MIGAWPLIMGITMFLQQKLNPQPVDPVQARMFMLLPIVFTYMLSAFPAGLVIYWAWNNLLSIAQQWIIMHRAGRSLNANPAPDDVFPAREIGAGARSKPAGCCSPATAGSLPAPPTAAACRRETLPEIAFARPLQCRQVEPDQRADRAAHAGAHLEHAGAHAADQLLRSRRAADAGRPAGLRLCRGVEEREIAAWTALMRRYLRGRATLRRVCLLIDARHGIKDAGPPGHAAVRRRPGCPIRSC